MESDLNGELETLGWCEWVSLPDLGIPNLRAKIDTGAKTSSLHAEECEEYIDAGVERVRYTVVTLRGRYRCDSVVHARRKVRSSSGHAERRPVVVAECVALGRRWPIELTLTDRTPMRFPMLLGRRAMEGRFVVNPAIAYVGGKPKRKKKR